MTQENDPYDRLRGSIDLLIKLQGMTRMGVAEAAGVKRPNLVGWLNKRNGISDEKLRAVLRAVHASGGALETGRFYHWKAENPTQVRDLLNLILLPEERKALEIFHVGRDTSTPVTILRSDCVVDLDGEHSKEVLLTIAIEKTALGPPLPALTQIHLGCGKVRHTEPKLNVADLDKLTQLDVIPALWDAHPNPVAEEDNPEGLLADLRLAPDDEMSTNLYWAVRNGGRESTRLMLQLAVRQPRVAWSWERARKLGYSDAQITGWLQLLIEKPEFSRVLVEAMVPGAAPEKTE